MTDVPTDKQEAALAVMRDLDEQGVHPTVREFTDALETSERYSERASDDEGRGLLERLEANGHVVQYTGDDHAERYKLAETTR